MCVCRVGVRVRVLCDGIFPCLIRVADTLPSLILLLSDPREPGRTRTPQNRIYLVPRFAARTLYDLKKTIARMLEQPLPLKGLSKIGMDTSVNESPVEMANKTTVMPRRRNGKNSVQRQGVRRKYFLKKRR